MIKEIAQHLQSIIIKGEYDNKRHIGRDIEDMCTLVSKVSAELNNLHFDSDLVTEIKDGLIENLSETMEVLEKSEELLDKVESELEQMAQEDVEHQGYCQEIFDRR